MALKQRSTQRRFQIAYAPTRCGQSQMRVARGSGQAAGAGAGHRELDRHHVEAG
jgi:hypothetical protein